MNVAFFLLFSICRKLSDWRLQLDISRKSDILSRAEHTAMSTWSLCTWGFHSHFFSSVTIVAREHSPVLVACVWRETKARSFFAQNLTSFALCYYVIGLFNRVQTNHKHKRKGMWFGCEQPFLWGSIAWHPKKWLWRSLFFHWTLQLQFASLWALLHICCMQIVRKI